MNKEKLLPLILYWMVEFSLSLTKPQAFIDCSYKSASCSLHFLLCGKRNSSILISTFTYSLRLVSPVMLTKLSVTGQLPSWDPAIHDCWCCLFIFLHSLNLCGSICNFVPFISRLPKQRSWSFRCCQLLHIDTLWEHSHSTFTACIKVANCKQVSTSPPPKSTVPLKCFNLPNLE